MIDGCFDPFVANPQTIGALTTISEILGGLEHERCTLDSLIKDGLRFASPLREVGARCCQPTPIRLERSGRTVTPFGRCKATIVDPPRPTNAPTYLITSAFGGLPAPPAVLRGVDTRNLS